MLAPPFQAFIHRVIATSPDLPGRERDTLLQSLANWSQQQMLRSMRRGLFMEEEYFTTQHGLGSGGVHRGAGMIRGLAAPFHLGDPAADRIFPLTPTRFKDLDTIIESQRKVGDGGKKLVTHRATVYNDKGHFRMTLSVDGGHALPAPALSPLPAPTAAASSDDESGADSADESDLDSAASDADDSAG